MTEASKEGLSLTMTTHPWDLQINFIQRAGVLSKRLSTMVTSASAAKKADSLAVVYSPRALICQKHINKKTSKRGTISSSTCTP